MGIYRLSALAAALMICAPVAHAQSIPRAVEDYARSIEKSCVAAYRGDWSKLAAKRNPEWLTTVAEDSSGKTLLVQGDKTRCEPQSQLICGTGGCPIGVFRVSKAGVKRLYVEQVLGWERDIDAGKPTLQLQVHGSRCGGVGSQACVTLLDPITGKRRSFKPKD